MDKAVVITVAAIAVILILTIIFFPGWVRWGENLPPEPDLKASATFINVNETVTFYANESFDRDGEIVKYYWDFDDGINGTGKYISHYYEKGGNYTVVLIITDDEGKKAVQAMTIHVNELPKPAMNITLPAYIHEPVYFEANDSYDPDGYVRDYFWDFGDGANETGMSVSHVYTTKEWLEVTLTITDNDNANAATSRGFDVQFRTWRVTWDTESIKLGGDSYPSDYNEGTSEILYKNINVLNITKVRFNLTWYDEQPYVGDPPLTEPEPNDEFIMNITSPNNEMYEGGPSTSEQIIVYGPEKGYMNLKPWPLTTQAESEEILRMLLAENYTKTNGTGKWTINITLTQALGALGGPPDLDYGEDWFLEVTWFYYYPVIKRL
jgi:chitodextrinase